MRECNQTTALFGLIYHFKFIVLPILVVVILMDEVCSHSYHTTTIHHQDNKISTPSGSVGPKIIETPSPSGAHRSYYQWNHSVSSFQQHYFLPHAYQTSTSSYEQLLKAPSYNIFEKYNASISTTNKDKEDHSQGQLPILLDIFANKSNGFFIDLAANHWKTGSNTIDLEQHFNWTGICIEPNPVYLSGLLNNRQCILIASPVYRQNNALIKFHMNGGLGGIIEEGMDNENMPGDSKNVVELSTVTLSTIATVFGPNMHVPQQKDQGILVFDYLSLDVEGGEYDALINFDFSRHIFNVISVEKPKDLLHEILIRHGYWFLTQAWSLEPFGEMIYIHYTFPRFKELMNKYRAKTNVRYSHAHKWHNPTFLLRPDWPMQANTPLEHNEFLRENDIVKCGEHSKQLYLYKGKKLHAIPSIVIFYKIGDGSRDMSETLQLSHKYCSKLLIGKALDDKSVVLPNSDPFWSL